MERSENNTFTIVDITYSKEYSNLRFFSLQYDRGVSIDGYRYHLYVVALTKITPNH